MQLPPLYTSTIFSWPLTETLSLLNSNSFPSLPTPEPHHSTLSLGTSYKWNHTVFVLLGLAHCILYNVCMVCPCRCNWMDFLLFHGWINILVCVSTHISCCLYPFRIFKNDYLFGVVLGFLCCVQTFSVCREWGLLSSCGVWASPCCGFSCCRAQAPGHLGLKSCHAWALELMGFSSCGTQA